MVCLSTVPAKRFTTRGSPNSFMEMLAKRIIDAATKDERDPLRLREAGLMGLTFPAMANVVLEDRAGRQNWRRLTRSSSLPGMVTPNAFAALRLITRTWWYARPVDQKGERREEF